MALLQLRFSGDMPAVAQIVCSNAAEIAVCSFGNDTIQVTIGRHELLFGRQTARILVEQLLPVVWQQNHDADAATPRLNANTEPRDDLEPVDDRRALDNILDHIGFGRSS